MRGSMVDIQFATDEIRPGKKKERNRVVEPWNHLPDHIVRASSVSLFRKLIDTVDLSGYCRY